MALLTFSALFLPLFGFLVLLLRAFKITRHATAGIACGALFLSFVGFLLLLLSYQTPETLVLYQWIPHPVLHANFALWLDPLSLTMALIITGVGFLIHLYSIGYMEEEKDYARYFALLNFFVFAMLLLVLASNLLLLFIGWEGVGLASYLLIGFWYEREEAAAAATKAFVVNRIGDLGLLLGLLLTFSLFHTSDIQEINSRAAQEFALGAPLLTLLTLLYFVGATGKSAQLPLHTWLPDAMEGPTPVSALIHAATMVTAGVYLVVRLHPLFLLAPMTLQVIGVVGGATALFAALCAIGQTDLKRVLAYSTISQLGFMFLACGAGAFYAAIFHLTMHAFMKALLFLSAGNVVHMLHGATQMKEMGGLARLLPKTHLAFLIGVVAMSGLPPLAAFFSKDLILEQEHLTGHEVLFYIGLLASILTAYYLTRAYCLTFLGTPKEETRRTVHEAPPIMLWPVGILALLSLIGGFFGTKFGKMDILHSFLSPLFTHEPPYPSTLFTRETALALFGALVGMGSAFFLYTKFKEAFQSTLALLRKAFYIDSLYAFLFVGPLKAIATWIAKKWEPLVFEDSIEGVAYLTQRGASLLQTMQSGQIRSYMAWMVVGATLLLLYLSRYSL